MESDGSQQVFIPVSEGRLTLPGDLGLPAAASGLVIFAHGSGSSRLSPRNRMVAANLRRAGFATLLFDLLTLKEAGERANVFDIALLAGRTTEAVRWARSNPETSTFRIGLFGSSTGAAAALVAAARLPGAVSAVVSRGGRPDLAAESLPQVKAPTLLVVGGADDVVIELNEAALQHLTCDRRLQIVPGATHLFEEPGALDTVVALASGWFADHLGAKARGG